MKKKMLAILVAAVGAWSARADVATMLKYEAVPAHVVLTVSGSYQGDFSVSVTGAVAGATLTQYSTAGRGWTITATADVGYDEPTFSTCAFDGTGDSLTTAQSHTGSVTRTGYNVHVYDIRVAPKQSTVWFSLAGGDLPAGAESSTTVTYGSTYGTLPTPTRTGYTFDGWFTDAEGGTQVTATTAVTITSAQTLYAHWTPISYVVEFKANGGSGTMPRMTLEYDQGTNLEANAFTRANYTFNKWRAEDGSYYVDRAWVANLASTAGDVVKLLADWTPVSYTITFDSAGGSDVSPVTRAFGSPVGSPARPTREGYDFVRWEPALPATMPPRDQTVRAVWRVRSYTLTYDSDGGSAIDAITQLMGTTVKAPADPTRAGYAFAGWSPTLPATMPSSNLTVTAKWTALPADDSYTISYDFNYVGGGAPTKTTFAPDETVQLKGELTRAGGYAFAGWALAADATTPDFLAGQEVNAGTAALFSSGRTATLYAVWDEAVYTLVFDGNGADGAETMTNWTVTVGAELTLPPNAYTRTGYAFAGWSNVVTHATYANCQTVTPGGAKNETVTLLARWTPYVVTFALDKDKEGFVPESIADMVANGSACVLSGDGLTLTASFTEGRAFGKLPAATNYMDKFSASLKSWRVLRDGVFQVVGEDMIAPPLSAGCTNLVAQWAWEPSDELAAALDMTGLEVTLVHVKGAVTNLFSAWTTNVQHTTCGGRSVLIQTNNYIEFTSQYIILTTTLSGPGRLTFDWRMESAQIGNISTYPTKWRNTTEQLLVETNDIFCCGFAADSNNWLTVSDADGNIADEGLVGELDDGWKSCAIDLRDVAPGVATTVNWRFSYRGNPPWPARVWIDNVQWDGATTVEAPEAHSYSVDFDKNGGEGTMASLDVDDADGTNLTANAFTREGYMFVGWNTQSNGTGLAVADGARVALATNTTLYAQWSTNAYTVTLDPADGSAPVVMAFAYGASVSVPDPVRAGYAFAGWSPELPATMPANDLTATAQWTATRYVITFDSDGGSAVPAQTNDYGSAVTAPADPVREGYAFAGWTPELPATMPASNLTATARWTMQTYTISFDLGDGGSGLDALEQEAGTAVVLPVTAPLRAGYVFAGWTPELPATMPAHDVAVTAQWTPEIHTIVFDTADGTEIPAISQEYGSAVAEPADPEREGYAFAGWSPAVPATMPANDLTVTAQWTPVEVEPPPAEPDVPDTPAVPETPIVPDVPDTPTVPDTPVQPSTERLYAAVVSELVESAATYDGYLYDVKNSVVGVIQVKRAKYNQKTNMAKVTATVTLAGGQKRSYKGGEWRPGSQEVSLTSAQDAHALKVVLGTRGLAGTYGNVYGIDGALNPFSSKVAAVKTDGEAVLAGIQSTGGMFVLAVPSAKGWGGISIEVRARGKVSVKGALADGTKVNVSSQLIVGEAACCIPVVSTKFAEPAFAVWLTRRGAPIAVVGLDGAQLAAARPDLAAGAAFNADAAALATAIGKSLLPEYLPNGYSVKAVDTKWLVADGAKVGAVKIDKKTGKLTTTSANCAALKLTYKEKTGLFTGSFKAYALADGRLKATTVKVSGVLVGGRGYGTATVKKTSAAVTIAPENN